MIFPITCNYVFLLFPCIGYVFLTANKDCYNFSNKPIFFFKKKAIFCLPRIKATNFIQIVNTKNRVHGSHKN